MIRFLCRFIGLWILAAGFIFVIYDGTKSIADHRLYLTRISDVWSVVHQGSMLALQPMIEARLPWLWNPGIVWILDQPAFLALGILGIVLILLGRKKKPLIGYSRN